MTLRNDFLYFAVENIRFVNLVNFDQYSDEYLSELVKWFNEADYHEVYKFNNHLTVEDVKFSINCFFEHINRNNYDYTLKAGILTWRIDKDIFVGLDSDKSNYHKLIDKRYLKAHKEQGYCDYP